MDWKPPLLLLALAPALAAGCTGYIEKPINPDTFVAQVEAYLPGDTAGTGGETCLES